MDEKTDLQKYGILVFNEMSVRKSLKMDLHSMRYQGVVNFGGEEAVSTAQEDLGDHALVFGFQSFSEDYFQPIGCFAAKGGTKGLILSKLVLQGIMLLEKAGAKVCGIICDGAKPNRKMWSEFGISGVLGATTNSFTNPCADDRKIYVISDMLHLFKCIRNRLIKHELMVCNILERMQYFSFFQISYTTFPSFLIVRPDFDGLAGGISKFFTRRIRNSPLILDYARD